MAATARRRATAASRRHGGWPLRAVALAVTALALLPLGYLVLRAAEGSDAAVAVLRRPQTWWSVARTVGLMAAVTATAVALAVPLGWLTTCTDLPGRRAWAVALALPLVLPSYVSAYLYQAALGPRGSVGRLLAEAGLPGAPPLAGFTGAWLVLSLATYPYVLLVVQSALRRQDPALAEASRSLGRGPLATFARVTLPGLRPAVAAGALLVALYTLRDFGAVSVLRFEALSQVIYVTLRASLDRPGAAMLSLLVVAITIAVLGLERALAPRRARTGAATARAASVTPCLPLGAVRPAAVAACAVVAALALGVPALELAHALGRGWARGQLVDVARLGSALGHTLLAATLAAAVTALAALPVAVAARGWPGWAGRWLERASYGSLALPPITVALAVVFLGLGVVPWLYQTLPLLVFAYAVLFLPEAIGYDEAALAQIPPGVEDSARSLGRSPWSVFRTITLPLAAPGFAAGAALVFLTTIKELPATLLLGPAGFHTLATDIWSAATEARQSQAAAPALVLILVASLPSAWLTFAGGRLRREAR